MKPRWLPALALTLAVVTSLLPASALSEELAHITLQHRQAEALIPLLEPLLETGGGISGQGQHLLIRTSPANLEALRPLIDQLDTPPKQLLIEVRQYNAGRERRGGVTFTPVDPSGQARPPANKLKVYRTREQDAHTLTQQLRLLEGQWGEIHTGVSQPVHSQQITTTPYGGVISHGLEQRHSESGFSVKATLLGSGEVWLNIRPRHETPVADGRGTIRQEGLTTTLRTRLNEWVILGSGGELRDQHHPGITYGNRQEEQTLNIELKVEMVR